MQQMIFIADFIACCSSPQTGNMTLMMGIVVPETC
jgi:hypothetical protein